MAELHVAVAEQDSDADVVGQGFVKGFELFGGVAEIAFFVIGQRKVAEHWVLLGDERQRGFVHADSAVEVADVNQGRA